MIDQKTLHEKLSYCPKTGLFRWKLKTCRKVVAGRIAGSKNKGGYIEIRIDRKLYLAHRLAWLYVYGELPNNVIDHIDQNPSNNSIANLRNVSQLVNGKNARQSKRNTSGVTGVSWFKATERWSAYATVDGVKHHLGYFGTFEAAVDARRKFSVKCNFSPRHGVVNEG